MVSSSTSGWICMIHVPFWYPWPRFQHLLLLPIVGGAVHSPRQLLQQSDYLWLLDALSVSLYLSERYICVFLNRTCALVSISVYFPFPPTFSPKASFLLHTSLSRSVWRSQSLTHDWDHEPPSFCTHRYADQTHDLDGSPGIYLNTWPWSRQIFSPLFGYTK